MRSHSVVSVGAPLFGKPNVNGRRRVGVALALGNTLEEARKKAAQVAAAVKIELPA